MSCCHSAPSTPNSGTRTIAAIASVQPAARLARGPPRHGISDRSSQPTKSPTAYPMITVTPDIAACRYHTRGSSDDVSDRQ
jgi:hypothetical protein